MTLVRHDSVHTTVVKLLYRHLVESHWRLDDLHLVTFPRDQLRNEQHIGEEEAVDVHLVGKDQAMVTAKNTIVCVCTCVEPSNVSACLFAYMYMCVYAPYMRIK